jgi:hypothetical protein
MKAVAEAEVVCLRVSSGVVEEALTECLVLLVEAEVLALDLEAVVARQAVLDCLRTVEVHRTCPRLVVPRRARVSSVVAVVVEALYLMRLALYSEAQAANLQTSRLLRSAEAP